MMKCTILRKVQPCEMYHMVLTEEASGTLEEMRKLATVYGDGGSYDKAAALQSLAALENREKAQNG